MKLTKHLVILLSGLFLFSAISAAEETTKRFREEGKVISFSKETSSLLIGDSGFALSPAVRILSYTNHRLSVDALRPGTNIKYNLEMPPGTKAPVITEILVMPSN